MSMAMALFGGDFGTSSSRARRSPFDPLRKKSYLGIQGFPESYKVGPTSTNSYWSIRLLRTEPHDPP